MAHQPYAGLVQGRDGYFYGTTLSGGLNDYGHGVPDGHQRSVDNAGFLWPATNGAIAIAGLVQGSDGYFYGTTGV